MVRTSVRFGSLVAACFAAGIGAGQIEKIGGPSPTLDTTLEIAGGLIPSVVGAAVGWDYGVYSRCSTGVALGAGAQSLIGRGKKGAALGTMLGATSYAAGVVVSKYFL